MDCTELLQCANHYRELAARMTGEQTRNGLLDLAERYEVLAEEVEKGIADHSADGED